MSKIITISKMDSIHQYDKFGNPITTWNPKYCGWVINKEAYKVVIRYNDDIIYDGKLL